jgi:hypothetical protein
MHLQDQLHQRLYQRDRAYLQAASSENPSHAALPTQQSGQNRAMGQKEHGWEHLLALGGGLHE